MLRYKTETRPGLVALYDIRPGNGAGPFLQPRSPHGAEGCLCGCVTVCVCGCLCGWVCGVMSRCVCVCTNDRNDFKLGTVVVLNTFSQPTDFGFKGGKGYGYGMKFKVWAGTRVRVGVRVREKMQKKLKKCKNPTKSKLVLAIHKLHIVQITIHN